MFYELIFVDNVGFFFFFLPTKKFKHFFFYCNKFCEPNEEKSNIEMYLKRAKEWTDTKFVENQNKIENQ